VHRDDDEIFSFFNVQVTFHCKIKSLHQPGKENSVKKEWMTPEELALETGYSRQTINKWIKREGWATLPKPGVQGGKARLIHIDEEVKTFLDSIRHVSEPKGNYIVEKDPLATLLLSSISQMTRHEKEQLSGLLLREGIRGMLQRLDIPDGE